MGGLFVLFLPDGTAGDRAGALGLKRWRLFGSSSLIGVENAGHVGAIPGDGCIEDCGS